MNYYNEWDKSAAQWLRNLISAGVIAPGDVDERSIEDVKPSELKGYAQCHFFAGIAGWAHALDLAGWPSDQPVWTGSCPCQPFSSAGKGDGFADQRHLWPAWFHLIRECKPDTVFGEQVASAIGHGWLDLVSADMEAEGYSIGGVVLGAHSVGAPHIRQRLYWVAHAGRQRQGRINTLLRQKARGWQQGDSPETAWSGSRGVALGDAFGERLEGHGRSFKFSDEEGRQRKERHGASSGFWNGDWRQCSDGKARIVKPGIEPLADGIPGRVVKLRAYGNAIVPQVGTAFISAFMESMQSMREAA